MAVKWATALNLLMSPTATSESGFGSLGSFVKAGSSVRGSGEGRRGVGGVSWWAPLS